MPTNPWLALPQNQPFVLESDARPIQAFNRRAKQDLQFDLTLMPEPYSGDPQAPVVVLNLNPGLSTEDAGVHARPEFQKLARHSLEHSLSPYPFLHLQPAYDTPGGRWWRARARQLIADTSLETVARGILCVQLFGYHSKRYSATKLQLPSTTYGHDLVRAAISRKAVILIMRSYSLWSTAVPELTEYKDKHIAKNPRAPYLSRGNLGAGYDEAVERLNR